jgi:hypothetical protein
MALGYVGREETEGRVTPKRAGNECQARKKEENQKDGQSVAAATGRRGFF